MLFKSPHALMVFKIRSAIPTRNAMGEVVATRAAIRAEFGTAGAEQAIHNPLTGGTESAAEIIGHFFDSDLWYEQRLGDNINNADEVARCQEEKDYLELVLQRKCREVPQFISQIERVRVPAGKPWASYDGQEPQAVVDAAQLLDLVPEAVAYERENQRRPDVLGPLEEALEVLPDDVKNRAQPPSEFEPGSFDLPGKTGVQVGKPQGRTEYGMVTEAMPGSSINLG